MTTTRPVRVGKLPGRVVLVGFAHCLQADCDWEVTDEDGNKCSRAADKHTKSGHSTVTHWRPKE